MYRSVVVKLFHIHDGVPSNIRVLAGCPCTGLACSIVCWYVALYGVGEIYLYWHCVCVCVWHSSIFQYIPL